MSECKAYPLGAEASKWEFGKRYEESQALRKESDDNIPVYFSITRPAKSRKANPYVEGNVEDQERVFFVCNATATVADAVRAFRQNYVAPVNERKSSAASGFIFFVKFREDLVLPKNVDTLGDLLFSYTGDDGWLQFIAKSEEIFG